MTPIPSGQVYFKAVDPVPAVHLSRQAPPNDKRITPVVYSDGALRKEIDLLHDATLGVDCKATRFADGATRCLPNRLFVETVYTDAACTAELKAATLSTCVSEAPKYGVENLYNPCQSDYIVYALGEQVSGPIFKSYGGRCEQLSGVTAYRAGAVLPLDQLALSTPTFEP